MRAQKPKNSTSNDPAWFRAYLDVEEQASMLKFQKNTVRRLASWVFRHKPVFFLGVGLTVLSTIAVLAEPRLLAMIIDRALVPKDAGLLKSFALAFLGLHTLRVLATIFHQYVFTLLGQKVMQDLRMAVFTHLQRLPVSLYDRIPSGKLVTRVSNDVSLLADMFTAAFVTIAGNLLMVTGIFIGLLIWQPRLGMVAVGIFPIMMGLSFVFSKWLQKAYRESRSRLSALNAFLAENILGIRIIQLFNREAVHEARFQRLNAWFMNAEMNTVTVYAYFQPTITVCTGISLAGVIIYGGGLVSEGALAPGVLAAYFAYVLAMFQPLRDVADNWNIFLSGMSSAERIFSILDWVPEEQTERIHRPAPELPPIQGHLQFENVWFAYDADQWILRDFNLEILPGQRVGIVGPTGSGKTTLISLLMRFYEPQKGRILLDGRDIREFDKRALRAHIGVIQQDVFLFSGSVEDNITLWKTGTETATNLEDPEIESIRSLQLNERGGNLSMGQRQLIAFARARRNNPSIWILDEATANIDSETEARVNQSLDECSKNKTTVLIAHRLSTVKNADKILVLLQGKLIESGTHAELMIQSGMYSRLYQLQEKSVTPSIGQ